MSGKRSVNVVPRPTSLTTSIVRADVRTALYVQPGLVASARQLPVLQSLIWKPFEANYRPFFARWGFNQRNVIALLRRNGCTSSRPTSRTSLNVLL